MSRGAYSTGPTRPGQGLSARGASRLEAETHEDGVLSGGKVRVPGLAGLAHAEIVLGVERVDGAQPPVGIGTPGAQDGVGATPLDALVREELVLVALGNVGVRALHACGQLAHHFGERGHPQLVAHGRGSRRLVANRLLGDLDNLGGDLVGQLGQQGIVHPGAKLAALPAGVGSRLRDTARRRGVL